MQIKYAHLKEIMIVVLSKEVIRRYFNFYTRRIKKSVNVYEIQHDVIETSNANKDLNISC